jgi:hypothetical protein
LDHPIAQGKSRKVPMYFMLRQSKALARNITSTQ